ncbi:MAG: radical SAM protein, partial [Hyphomicrobiaceae bacterium]
MSRHQRPRADATAVEADRRRGRRAVTNASGRFESARRDVFDDGWESLGELEPFKTHVRVEIAKSIITTNDSPDISFDQSINPYRGCEHGCIYCYARPSHCFLGYSAGLDFETQLSAKTNAAELLQRELARPSYTPKVIALGTNTDPYQPIEREHQITRSILEVLDRCQHPVGIVTKSALVTRDLDILSRMAAKGLAKVALSVTT